MNFYPAEIDGMALPFAINHLRSRHWNNEEIDKALASLAVMLGESFSGSSGGSARRASTEVSRLVRLSPTRT
jgi:hypothetical protein